jgi:hypothetical protein
MTPVCRGESPACCIATESITPLNHQSQSRVNTIVRVSTLRRIGAPGLESGFVKPECGQTSVCQWFPLHGEGPMTYN